MKEREEISLTGNTEHEFTMMEAITEAHRCLHCAKPLCRTGCPINNDIPEFIAAIGNGNFGDAYDIISQRSSLPSICGRICPKENQCEGACILNRAKKPINIGQLERFASDFVRETSKGKRVKPIIKDQGKIAVIGSGPAGISAAGDMAKAGYEVTVFEENSEPGGILMFGIPEFRLAKRIVRGEIEKLKALGVQFTCNTRVGKDITIDQLLDDGYDAVFIGVGTSLPTGLSIPGMDKPGVIQATELLDTVQHVVNGEADESAIPIRDGDTVIVIGAGNVAMDAARCSLRLTHGDVTVVYRRGQINMAALPSEFEEAKEEGVEFKFYSAPMEVVGDEKAEGLRYETQKVLEDATMVPTGEFGIVPANKIVIAIGHKPDRLLGKAGNDVGLNDSGYVITNEAPYYGMTNRAGVFAAGDVVHKPATVVLAMREGKKAAEAMSLYCQNKKTKES